MCFMAPGKTGPRHDQASLRHFNHIVATRPGDPPQLARTKDETGTANNVSIAPLRPGRVIRCLEGGSSGDDDFVSIAPLRPGRVIQLRKQWKGQPKGTAFQSHRCDPAG